MHVLFPHRRRGSAAFFAPYIAALPPQPPCPWLLPPGELDAAFAKLGMAGAAVLLCCGGAPAVLDQQSAVTRWGVPPVCMMSTTGQRTALRSHDPLTLAHMPPEAICKTVQAQVQVQVHDTACLKVRLPARSTLLALARRP
jgi:hypothetical protein